MSDLNKRVKRAVVIDFVSRLINQGRGFIVSIFLARLLSPSDFGVVGLAMSFITIAAVFTNFGLGASLIQKDHLTEKDYSSVFWLNTFAGIVLTLLLIAASFFCGWYYQSKVLQYVLICVSFSVLINSVNIVQNAMLIKRLENRIQMTSNVLSSIVGSVIAIIMAFQGFGLWSLVASILIGDILKTMILWYNTEWRPKLVFSWAIINEHFSSSKFLFFSYILNGATEKLDGFVIGKLYSLDLVGLYQRAQGLNQLAVTYSSATLFKVLLPTFSHLKHDKEKFDNFAISSLHLVSFVVFMLAGFMYCTADAVILLLYSSKWLSAVPYYKIMAYSVYAYPVSAILVNIISGKGENKAFFKLEIVKKIILVLTLGGFLWGVEGYLYTFSVAMLLSVVLNVYWVYLIAQIPMRRMIGAIFPYSIILMIAVLSAQLPLDNNVLISNGLSCTVFTVFLCLFCFFSNLEGIHMFTRLLNKIIKRT